MKRIFSTVALLLMAISPPLTYAAGNVQIDIRVVGDTIHPEIDPTLDFWIANDAVCGGFQVPIEPSSPDGVTWTWVSQASGWGDSNYVTHVSGSRIDPPATLFDLTAGILVVQSELPNKLMFGAGVLFGAGMAAGELQHVISVHINTEVPAFTVGTLCVDLNVSVGPGTIAFMDYGGMEMNTTFLDANNDGVWCFPVPGAIAVDETAPNVPTVYSLGQNYPNPSTVIAYSMERRGKVDISIFNVLGQLVKTLVSGEVDAGAHQAIWDGTDRNGATVASGVYSYRMVTDRYIETRKMTLMR
jgi:hypothetical protein